MRSPGSTVAPAAPERPMPRPMKQNQRVRRISSCSSASSGERTVDAKNNVVHVAISGSKGKSTITVDVEEKAAWDALGITPTVVDGLVKDDQQWAAKQKHVTTQLTWNRFQHRLYRVTCTATPCDAVIKSLRFAAPEPTK